MQYWIPVEIMIPKEFHEKLKPGTTVKVHETIKDGDKTRQSVFQGIILSRKHGSEQGATFTVRGTVASVGVEKIYPLHTPIISKVEIISTPKRVRRAKLYYLRDLSKRRVQQKIGV